MDLTNILLNGVPITTSSEKNILEYVLKYLEPRIPNREVQHRTIHPLVIFTPNPEIMTYASTHSSFHSVLASASVNLPDGQGVVWALKKQTGAKVPRISGVDMVIELSKISGKEGFTIGLIGGRNGVAIEASECLKRSCIDLKTVVFDSPEVGVRGKGEESSDKKYELIINDTPDSFSYETDEYFRNLIAHLYQTNVDILFVALGCPKQEYFIDTLRDYLSRSNYHKPLVLMAVGGSFDMISGRIKRAPIFMRKLGLEWLYRLAKEPWRLRRQLRAATFFSHS